jgi:hypothetical protein
MEIFTAKTFHESPREVYKAAMKGAVKVTHSHLGESFILKVDDIKHHVSDGVIHKTVITGEIK